MSEFDDFFGEMGVPALKEQVGDLIVHNPGGDVDNAESITATVVDLDNTSGAGMENANGHRLELRGIIKIDATVVVTFGPTSADVSTFIIGGETWITDDLIASDANLQTIGLRRAVLGTTRETRE